MARNEQDVRIEAYFPNYYDNYWVSHSCKSLLDGMQLAGANTNANVLVRDRDMERKRSLVALPRQLHRLPFISKSFLPELLLNEQLVWRTRPGTCAYFWLRSPLALIERVRRRGGFVVREMVNCTLQRRRFELDRAYELLGWECAGRSSDEEIQAEKAELLAADAVFCPNPQVRASVAALGVADSACIDCSYGWSESRLAAHGHRPQSHDGVNVLFVGTVDVRKGVPWLLQAWAKAKIRGTLYLAGNVDPQIAERGAAWLNQPSVKLLGHVSDIASVYDKADIFVFPSWEEGGPMVTLEAMACGLPCIVTPMGTSGAVTEAEGIIVEPGSVEAISEALVRLGKDAELRAQLGNSAFQKSRDYTWSRAGALRLERLRQNLVTWQNAGKR